MENRPPHLKCRDQVAIGPALSEPTDSRRVEGPVLEAKIADRRRRVRRFLECEGACLDGTSGDERVRKKCQFLLARDVRRDVRLDPRER